MIVGLTGGIATGKSTVTIMLRELGAYVVDADVWARRVVEVGSDGLKEIAQTFGESVLHADGSLNRAELGRIVFADREAREKLNSITHPRVRTGMNEETETYRREHPGQPVVWDVPLLFEGETRKLVDQTILVYVPEAIQLQRLMNRDGIAEADALARIRAQMPIEEKRKLANIVIDNSHSLEETRQQVKSIWATIQRQAEAEQAGQS